MTVKIVKVQGRVEQHSEFAMILPVVARVGGKKDDTAVTARDVYDRRLVFGGAGYPCSSFELLGDEKDFADLDSRKTKKSPCNGL